MSAKTINVSTQRGSVTGNVAFYAKGEPRLLKIREAFISGKRSREEVISAVRKIVGFKRLNDDWGRVTDGIDTFAMRQQAWYDHVAANPEVNRLYGDADIIAEFVMAPEEDEKDA